MSRTLMPFAALWRFALITLLLSPAELPALEVPGPLVEPAWVAQRLDAVVILDIRKDPDRRAGGVIPGAVRLDWARVQSERTQNGVALIGLVPEKAEFERLMRDHGVDQDSAIVITSPGHTTTDATRMARMYWTLKYFGHDNVAILNGGNAQWVKENHPLRFESQRKRRGNFLIRQERQAILATTQAVEDAVKEGDIQLIDARSLGEYLGVYKASSVNTAGHIPGAKLYPFSLAFRGDPTRFRTREELKSLARAFHIDLSRPSIVYCNTGVLSAADWFIFHELLGHDQARLYDGSMHAWTRTGQRPVETMTINLE